MHAKFIQKEKCTLEEAVEALEKVIKEGEGGSRL